MAQLVTGLPATLNRRAVLAPESTTAVCRAVRSSKSFAKDPGTAGAPTPKDPVALSPIAPLALRPIDLLRTLGIAMLPPQHVRQSLTSWHWALIRYAYLIDPTPTPGDRLATNALAGDYRHHHMTALSEAVGVGCALSYAMGWLRAQIPSDATVHDPIDFDYVLGAKSPPLSAAVAAAAPHAAGNASGQPDYLVGAQRPDGDVRLLVVECKGNSSSRAASIRQLGKAMHQLEGITFAGHAGAFAFDRHAYCTRLTKSGAPVELLAVDPPARGRRWVRPEPSASEDRLALGEWGPQGRLFLPSPEDVTGRLVQRLDDRALAWAGAGAGAEIDLRRVARLDCDFGAVAGATSSLRLPDGPTVEVFTGALVEVLEAALDPDPARARESRAAVRRAVAGAGLASTEPQEPSTDHSEWRSTAAPLRASDDPEQVASAIGEDGLALRIEIR
jgi:hypothetical protein